ncbi:MAG: FAD:protein FMN transferase [Planctomycetota bacterium]|nr:MAG: FAD:protein FMN transferase [Planctomycetota bacterium]
MNNKTVRMLVSIAIIVVVALLVRNLAAPKGPQLQSGFGGGRLVMGTFANITAVASDDETIKASIEAAFDKLVEVDEMMSDYKADSELSVVNRDAFAGPVKVSDELFEVLKASVDYSRKTQGAFDITVGPVVELWRRAAKDGKKPGEEELAEARAGVGYEKLILDEENKTVRFAVVGMKLDLGAIAKGYGVDRAIEEMKKAGAAGGLVDVGGDICCFGASPKFDNIWRVGLEAPSGVSDYLLVLKLSDTAIATSGDYRRFVVVDGRRYSHIIDPATTASAGELTSVTVIAARAMDADALATAVSVMGRAKGLGLIESINNAEAIIIPADKKLEFVKTSGADAYIRK